MSLLPLPNVECTAVAKCRKVPYNVVGTVNAPYGHRLRDSGDCKIVQKKESIFEKLAQKNEKEERQYEHFLKTWEFERETNRKIRNKKVRTVVEEGMAMHEENVNIRRQKLRELITEEEVALTREIVDQAQHGDDTRMDEMRERTEQLRKEQEEKRLAVVAAKRMQQYIARCPDIRQQLKKRSTMETKHCNLVQIAENEAKRRSEKELEELWHELMLKEVAAKEKREIDELRKRSVREKDAMLTLAKQVAGKLALEEEEKRVQKEEREYLEKLWENVRREELRKLENERKNREVLRKDLLDQIMNAKRILAERAREETAMDLMLKELADEELRKEKEAIQETSAALRKELLSYLKYLEELREEEARRNLEVDLIVQQSMKDAQTRRDLAVRKFNETRQRNLQEVLRGREEQVKTKRQMEEEERRKYEQEKRDLMRQLELDAKLTAQQREIRKQEMLRYGQHLKEQKEYIETMKRRELEEEERIYRDGLKKEEEYHKLTEELLKASENVMPHPFKTLLEQCAARLTAEKEGLCYCPPPLPPE